MARGEVFYFDYGCLAFWGLSERQEREVSQRGRAGEPALGGSRRRGALCCRVEVHVSWRRCGPLLLLPSAVAASCHSPASPGSPLLTPLVVSHVPACLRACRPLQVMRMLAGPCLVDALPSSEVEVDEFQVGACRTSGRESRAVAGGASAAAAAAAHSTCQPFPAPLPARPRTSCGTSACFLIQSAPLSTRPPHAVPLHY